MKVKENETGEELKITLEKELFSPDNNKFVSLFLKSLKEPLTEQEKYFVINYAEKWEKQYSI